MEDGSVALVSERFDERERSAGFREAISVDAFPPWVIYGDPASDVWWDRVRSWFPEFSVVLSDDGELVASGWAVPIAWDGTRTGLPSGYTASLRCAVEGRETGTAPNTLVVCAAVVLPIRSRTGLAGSLLSVIRDLPAAHDLPHVLVPVRPTLKSSYPLTPIDVITAWTRPDGLPLDPWLRTHVRVGGTVLATAPASQTLTAPVADWERWTGLDLPSTGDYFVAGGLAPLHVDRDRDVATLVEPNVWVQHR